MAGVGQVTIEGVVLGVGVDTGVGKGMGVVSQVKGAVRISVLNQGWGSCWVTGLD